MSTFRLSRTLLTLAVLVAAFSAGSLRAQSFALGGGFSFVNDTGPDFSTTDFATSFDTVGGHLFGEVVLDENVLFQLRASQFGLEGSTPASPNLRATAGTASVSYLFHDAWLKAGFVAGAGVYRVVPRPVEEGQEKTDVSQTAFGFFGGLLGVFDIDRRWDARLEVTVHSIRTDYRHTPVFVTAGVSYHF